MKSREVVEYDQSDKNDKKCYVHLNVLTSVIILYEFVFLSISKEDGAHVCLWEEGSAREEEGRSGWGVVSQTQKQSLYLIIQGKKKSKSVKDESIIWAISITGMKSRAVDATRSLIWDKKYKFSIDKDTVNLEAETCIDLDKVSSQGTALSSPSGSKISPSL